MLKEITEDFEKIKSKHSLTKQQIQNIISHLTTSLIDCENAIELASKDESKENIKENIIKILDQKENEMKAMEIEKNYNNIMNSFYGSLTKLGKIMKKDFDVESIDYFHLYEYDKLSFYNIIVKDLYRRGDFKTADSLIQEANLKFDENFRFIFKDLNIITRDLKNRIISSLHNWCLKYKTILENMKSTLPFECVKIEYILMLNNNDIPIEKCVEFAKKEFHPFLINPIHQAEIPKLMTLLIFKNNPISKCPYNEFNIDELWSKISTLFINNCCTILNLPNESGFYLSIVCGMISLPQILNAETILKSKKEIMHEKELPYEIQLPNQLKFHNLFICPVTKEISTPENPPMLLSCGHCVSQKALEKMQRVGGLHSNQIKCPTCPNVQNIKDAQKLFIF